MLTLHDFISRLKSAKIHFTLSSVRDEAVMVHIAVPGERWEVEFLSDGSIEIETFRSNGQISGPECLANLFDRFSDSH